MDKLLQLIEKLRNEIVPEQPLSKMSKPDLVKFIEEAQILERMRTFHEKGNRGIRSTITEDDDEQLIPGAVEIQRWRVGKLRKLLRDFHRSTQILKKFNKYTSGRLRSHIKRHRYEEMLFGDDLPDVSDTDDEKRETVRPRTKHKAMHKKKKEKKDQQHKTRSKSPIRSRQGDIIINTAPQAESKEKKCGGCCEEKENKIADQDFFAMVQNLAPNLYKVLAEKAYLLDICSLDKKRVSANVCPIDCTQRAWDELACCECPTTTSAPSNYKDGEWYDEGYPAVCNPAPPLCPFEVQSPNCSGVKTCGVGH